MHCSKCLIKAGHPFGVFFDENGVCSGCNAFSQRLAVLPNWNSLQEQLPLTEKFMQQFGSLPEKVIVPFEADGVGDWG